METGDPRLQETLPTPPNGGLQPGRLVFGRFRLLRPLGRGGMGVVMLARDEEFGEDVALKFVADLVRWHAGAMAQLRSEARRARRLTHPCIVRTHELFTDEADAAIAMEFVSGGSLTDRRLELPHGIFEVANVQPWLAGVCAALDYAHRDGKVVHRDIKPTNLLWSEEGIVKVSDFGISRSLSESATQFSNLSLGGTLAYMSPQQLMGEAASAADDIYSLGATLYELMTGKPPFYTGHMSGQIERRRPDSIAGRRRTLGLEGLPVPQVWEETIAACLEKDPALRPQSAAEIAEALVGGGRRVRSLRREVLSGSALRMRSTWLGVAAGALAAAAVWWASFGRLETPALPGGIAVPGVLITRSDNEAWNVPFSIRVAPGLYRFDEDLDAAARQHFGAGARLADVRDVERLQQSRRAAFNGLIGGTEAKLASYLVRLDGYRFHGDQGHFFVTTAQLSPDGRPSVPFDGPEFIRTYAVPAEPDGGPRVLVLGGPPGRLPFLAFVPAGLDTVWRVDEALDLRAPGLPDGWHLAEGGIGQRNAGEESWVAAPASGGFALERVLDLRENNGSLEFAWGGRAAATQGEPAFRMDWEASDGTKGAVALRSTGNDGEYPQANFLRSGEPLAARTDRYRSDLTPPAGGRFRYRVHFIDYRLTLEISDAQGIELHYREWVPLEGIPLVHLTRLRLSVRPGPDEPTTIDELRFNAR